MFVPMRDKQGSTQINFFGAPTPRSHPSYQLLFGTVVGALGAKRLVQDIKRHIPARKEYTNTYDSD